MRIKKLQNDQGQSVLLVVHDENGRAHDIIESLSLLLRDLLNREPPPCPECGGEGSVTTATPDSTKYEAISLTCTRCQGNGRDNLLQRYGFNDFDNQDDEEQDSRSPVPEQEDQSNIST